jgi:hypothetical protein
MKHCPGRSLGGYSIVNETCRNIAISQYRNIVSIHNDLIHREKRPMERLAIGVAIGAAAPLMMRDNTIMRN